MTRLLYAEFAQNQSLPLASPVLRKQSVHALGPVLPFADAPVLVLDAALPGSSGKRSAKLVASPVAARRRSHILT